MQKHKETSVMMWRTKLTRLICPVSPLVLPVESFCLKPITPTLTDRKGTLFLYPVPISPLTPNRILIHSPAWMWLTACFTVIRGRQPSPSRLRTSWNAALAPGQAKGAVFFYIFFNTEMCVAYACLCEVTAVLHQNIVISQGRIWLWNIHALCWPRDLVQEGYVSFKEDKRKSLLIWLTLASEMGIISVLKKILLAGKMLWMRLKNISEPIPKLVLSNSILNYDLSSQELNLVSTYRGTYGSDV